MTTPASLLDLSRRLSATRSGRDSGNTGVASLPPPMAVETHASEATPPSTITAPTINSDHTSQWLTVPGPGAKQAEDIMRTVFDFIDGSIAAAPRSLQKRIGPSEIGIECDHCLAAKLAEWDKNEKVTAWLPFIGTAVHAQYERMFARLAKRGVLETMQENKVTVGTLAGVPITGSTDLYIPATQTDEGMEGMTVDWKIVGTNTLDALKRERIPSRQYVVQAMLYAKGWNDAGYPTSHVCISYQPRNLMFRHHGYTWIAPYDPQIALDALARINTLYATLAALEQVSVETRDQYITSLSRDPKCYSCKKYPDWEHYQGRNLNSLIGGHNTNIAT